MKGKKAIRRYRLKKRCELFFLFDFLEILLLPSYIILFLNKRVQLLQHPKHRVIIKLAIDV